jgi:Ca2+-transporting ATPase
MSTLHRSGDRWLVAVKGSPAEIASRCDRIRLDGAVRPLSDRSRRELLAANERMAGQAQRVLAVAYRYTDRRGDMAAEHLVWVGLAGLQDPLRPGMRDLMQLYRRAGVRCVMITGDQSATAYAIGRQLGLGRDGQLEILDSSRLDRLDPDLLAALVRKVDVFARVSPAHKLRIVQAMQQAGLVVAMTGDGINDGPALKAADIGIAMGAGGSDVARSVADVVIEDDNLHTMAEAVHQGRAIYRNIRKTVHYLLSTNFSEIEVMLGALLLGLGQPLTPMQLLWMNLVTDIFPGLALSLEPAEPDLMRQPPRPGGEPIITNRRLGRMALESALITGGALSAFLYGRATGGPNHGSTLAFHTLTTAQLLHALYCRSERQGLFNPGQREPNRWLELALGGTAALHMLAALLPSTRRLLNLTPVRIVDIGLILAAAASPMLLNEAAKLGIGSGDADPKDLLSKESQR